MLKKNIITLLVLLTCMVYCFGAESSGNASLEKTQKPAKFVQDEFILSAWGDMSIDEHAEQNYKDMKDANFNVVLNFFVRKDEDVLKQLDIAQKNGMKVLVYRGEKNFDQDDESLKKMLVDHPACMGYFLCDEPYMKKFDQLAKQAKVIRRLRPGKMVYVNLFPSFWGISKYNKYIQTFIDTSKPDVVSVDRYPRFGTEHEQQDLKDYVQNIGVIRDFALKNNIPFWWFLCSTPHYEGSLQEPTEGQLRWQVYAPLTYGAKGLLYFTYWRPPFASERFKKDSALLDSRYNKNRLYYKAKRVNNAVKNLGPTLMQLTSTGAFRVTPDQPLKKNRALLKEFTLEKAEENDRPLNLLVGTFKHNDGRKAVMITNFDHAYTTWLKLKPTSNNFTLLEVDQNTGKEIPLYDEAPRLEGYQISLDSGEGRLFIIEEMQEPKPEKK